MRNRAVTLLLLFLLFIIYYACTSVPDKKVSPVTSRATDELCNTHSSFYKLEGSLALPLVTDIPDYTNSDSLIAFLQNKADSFSWRTFIALNWRL